MQFPRRPAALCALLALAACGAPAAIGDAERGEIERLLADYRRAMTDAYARGDAGLLAEVATERERARVANALATLANEGTAVRPTLVRATTESIERSGRTAWTVTVAETWDLRTVALGTEQPLGESLAQENRILYTVVREEGRWWVLTRLLASSSAGS